MEFEKDGLLTDELIINYNYFAFIRSLVHFFVFVHEFEQWAHFRSFLVFWTSFLQLVYVLSCIVYWDGHSLELYNLHATRLLVDHWQSLRLHLYFFRWNLFCFFTLWWFIFNNSVVLFILFKEAFSWFLESWYLWTYKFFWRALEPFQGGLWTFYRFLRNLLETLI